MGTCQICRDRSSTISKSLGVCRRCMFEEPDQVRGIAADVHARLRRKWALPGTPPRDSRGVACNLCVNRCRIADGNIGYCGLRRNHQGRLEGVSSKRGKLSWYLDPLPTNCVGDWICPGGTGCGYPRYAHHDGPEYGFQNLAVFCHACTFDCLYCQNWHFRTETHAPHTVGIADVSAAVTRRTACICYFGGDPSPQIPFLLNVSRKAIEDRSRGILRICWETNGSMADSVIGDLATSALDTGGCIKFDLKAWNETLHLALTGVTNRQTLRNFRRLARRCPERQSPPFLIASTLLVPGYVEAEEVGHIAAFISALDPQIPYSLLAFHPQHEMRDLPPTSRRQAEACLDAARNAGLKRVRVGNIHLLW